MQKLEIAEERNLTPLEIATDSMGVIRMLNFGNGAYDPILFECMLLIQKLNRIRVKHNYREYNGVTYLLAKERANKEFFLVA